MCDAGTVAEGYIRPGCVHVTLQSLLDRDTALDAAQQGVRPCVTHLMKRESSYIRPSVGCLVVGSP